MAYLTTFNHWIRKLSFIKSKEVKYRVWVNKKPAGKFFRKIKKIKIRFFSAEKFAVSTKIASYSNIGYPSLPIPYLAKKSCLKSKI